MEPVARGPSEEPIAGSHVMLASESLSDSRDPQPRYQLLVEAGVVEAMPGVHLVASRAAVEATLKNSEVFSSEGFLELGQRAAAHPVERRPAAATSSTARSSTRSSRPSRWTPSRATSPTA